jgi:hypothetical protein
MARKKIVKKSYTLWITIEEHTEYSDGTEKYRDMKDEETRSVGRFSNLKDADEQMQTLGEIHMRDGDVTI